MDAYARSKTPTADRDLRQTPMWLVDALLSELNLVEFDWDICAEPHTAKASKYLTEEDDALRGPWALGSGGWIDQRSFVFMNPPYSDVTPWLEAANQAALDGLFVVGVLPDDRGTRWYQTYIEGVATHCWLPLRRVSFCDGDGVEQRGNPKATVCPLWTPWRTRQTTYSRLRTE